MAYNRTPKPALVKGKRATTDKGFQKNITRERDEGKKMDQSVAIAYGEADDALRKAHEKVKRGHRMAKKHKS